MTTSSSTNANDSGGEAEVAHEDRVDKSNRAEWRANRRRNRALGLDRFGQPLPRVAGTNPRALLKQLDDAHRDGRRLAEVQLARKLGWVE